MSAHAWAVIALLAAVALDHRKLFRPRLACLSVCECRISWLNLGVIGLISLGIASIPHEVSALVSVASVATARLANIVTAHWRRAADQQMRDEGRRSLLARARTFLDTTEPAGGD